MSPYWTSRDGRYVLYCCDCRDVLPTLAAGSFDAVVTDPPYGNNYSTGWRDGVYRPSTAIVGDLLEEPLLNDVASATEPLLNDVAALYWFAAPDRLDMVLPILRQRWAVVNVLAWDKGNCTAGDLDCSYGKQWEACVYAVTKKHPLLGGRDRDVLRFSRGDSASYVHPTQKPVELIAYLIQRHKAVAILDPFAGSGTTGVACIRAGRRFVGVEIEERYCRIAVRRMEAELAQPHLPGLEPERLAESTRTLFDLEAQP